MKTILVTGATSGIGEQIVKQAIAHDYQVIACGRNQSKLKELSALPNVSIRCFDITEQSACDAHLKDVQADIYILNAGVCEYVDINKFESDMFKRVFDANFFGVVNCVSALLPKLRKGNQVLLVDSLARLLPFTRSQAYGASKAALHYFCKSLEVDIKHRGIKVKSVSPGFVSTPLTDKNDFDMPMVISPQQAAHYILRGIEQSSSNIYFPKRFSWLLRCLNMLPDSLKLSISQYLKHQS